MPTTPPFEAEYAAWPIWPSNAATDAVFTMAPRSPYSSSGSVWLIAVAASRMQLKVPMRLIVTTFVKMSSEWADEYSPSLPIVRCGQPMPAQLTSTRNGPRSLAASTAAMTSSSTVTSVCVNEPSDFLGDGLALVVLQVRDDDLGAALGEQPGGRLAEARRPARDDR